MPATQHSKKPWALIMAAGRGVRLSAATGGTYKQLLLWRGRPLYWHSALAMSRSAALDGLIFVFPPECLVEEEQRLRKLHKNDDMGLPWIVAAGGERRQDSVRCGLEALPPGTRHVLIHDAARPFVGPALARSVRDGLDRHDAVVPGLPITDTVKTVENSMIRATLPREHLVAVQTPQGFEAGLLRKAHARALECGLTATDDAALMEAAGHDVLVVPGDPNNVKITRAEDLALLADDAKPRPCVGMGYDVHRYGNGRPFILGGVRIPGAPEVVAHSDGDALLHALMDALLGCAGLGDIGQHFPDSDARFENISSAVLLSEVLTLIRRAGIRPTHVDMNIVAQKPRISPWREEIRNNVARLLNLPAGCVNLKAGTEEGLGFTGRGEGIKAGAIVCAFAETSRHPDWENPDREEA
ncbi:MAG: 2-C-methyl-D-erythritol 4-phosphate cytidylyltransferase [Desulfovibrio sp.]|jgi:2-C-methyl-D-erythritol 4-phosphate cytidylyltransferase/2-C-methyl-D-erythritol 2,4-cyclodiphosphate synthase|nr:2-C-methyl-D-erythritol 4-phosphate cytidylyltransferase [Desulfovibrio sp.]